MEDQLNKDFAEYGFLEIDYNKPWTEQIEVGDLLVTTEMFVVKGYGNKVEVSHDIMKSFDLYIDKFTVLDVEKVEGLSNTYYVQFTLDNDPENDGWFSPQGRIFIKKNKINYVTMQVPDFLVSKFESLGAKTIADHSDPNYDEKFQEVIDSVEVR